MYVRFNLSPYSPASVVSSSALSLYFFRFFEYSEKSISFNSLFKADKYFVSLSAKVTFHPALLARLAKATPMKVAFKIKIIGYFCIYYISEDNLEMYSI